MFVKSLSGAYHEVSLCQDNTGGVRAHSCEVRTRQDIASPVHVRVTIVGHGSSGEADATSPTKQGRVSDASGVRKASRARFQANAQSERERSLIPTPTELLPRKCSGGARRALRTPAKFLVSNEDSIAVRDYRARPFRVRHTAKRVGRARASGRGGMCILKVGLRLCRWDELTGGSCCIGRAGPICALKNNVV